jgi:hypothetical protein
MKRCSAIMNGVRQKLLIASPAKLSKTSSAGSSHTRVKTSSPAAVSARMMNSTQTASVRMVNSARQTSP